MFQESFLSVTAQAMPWRIVFQKHSVGVWRLYSDHEECGVGWSIKISSLWMLKWIVKNTIWTKLQ